MIDEPVHIEGGAVDLAARAVRRDGADVPLTEIEAALFGYLAARPGESIARATLLVEVWGYHPDSRTRAIDAAMRRLRTKVERDPAEPRHLLAVRGVGYSFAPLVAPQWAHLVGRAALMPQIAAARGLVTLVGPGGVGKTSIARALDDNPFVDLSGARSLAQCLLAVAAILDAPVPKGPVNHQIAGLGHALAHQAPTRLVLDNIEQVRPAMQRCVPVWRTLAPGTTLLLTSREALGLPTERVVAVPPLTAADAVTLLEALTPAGWTADPALPRLVERLDRLPLGLELAAGRAGLLTAGQMIVRLDRLAAPTADAPRQASLDASIAWSWDLCTPAERATLAALSLFVGQFDVDAVEALVATPADALPALTALAGKHLVQRHAGQLRLLESIRAFARGRLAAADPARRRFARWCLTRSAAGVEDLPNLLSAFDGIEALDPPLALAVGVACDRLLFRRGPEDLRAEMIVRCAALPVGSESSADVAHLRLAQADLARRHGDFEQAAAWARTAADLAESLGAADLQTRALSSLGNIAHCAGQGDAEALFVAAIERSAQADLGVQAEALRGHANLLLDTGRLAESDAVNARALHLMRLAGDVAAEAVLQGSLGVVALEDGRDAEAHAALARALSLHRQRADRRFAAVAQTNLAQVCHAMGDLTAATRHAEESRQAHRHMGNRRFEGFACYILAAIAHERGALERALAELTRALQLWRAVDERRFAGYGACRLALLEVDRGAIAAARPAAAQAIDLLEPHDAAFARWALDGGAPPAPASSFGRICRRIIDRPT